MENYIQNIELINNYLNKRLSESEIQNFENRLKTDSNFNTLFDEHTTFLEGIKRQQLKTDIVKGNQTYIKVKWMKFLGISIAVLAVAAVIYFAVSNKSIEPIQNKNLENNSIVVDTIPSKKTIETSTKIDGSIILKDFISSKKEVIKGEALKPIKNVETSFKKTPQKLKINTQKDTVLVLKEDTKLSIKANSFVDTKGNLVNGTIDVNVTEYYKLSDMLLANLSTTSNGKQLETGGMLFIEAKKSEVDLKLKKNSSIEISFPTASKKESMKLFSGEWKNDIINWELENDSIEEIIEVEELDEDIEVPFAVVEEVPVFPGCENIDETLRRKCMSDKISTFVNKKFDTEFANEIGLSGRKRVNVIFKIDKTGSITDIRARANHPELEEEAIRVISLLPKMKPGIQRGKTVDVPYSLPIIFQVEGDAGDIPKRATNLQITTNRQNSSSIKKFEEKMASKDSAEVTLSEVNGYILRTSKLGWINCDRFTRNRSRINYKLKIKNRDGRAKVNMVFKSLNVVLPSRNIKGYFSFGTVAKDEDVTLIAIKKQNGKLYLDVFDTKTKENPNLEFNFKEVNLQELKHELKKLDKLF